MPNPKSTHTTEELILANVTGTGDVEWMRALKETSHLWRESTLRRISDVQLTLEEEPGAFVVLAYTSPVQEVADGLAQGSAPSEVLVRWQRAADQLINLHSSYATRLVVLETRNGPVKLKQLGEIIRHHTGVGLQGLHQIKSLNTPTKDSFATNVELQMAAHILLNMRRAKELLAQLAAIRVSSTPEPLTSDLVELFLDGWRNKVAQEEQTSKHLDNYEEQSRLVKALESENSLVIEQLHKAQEEIERYVQQGTSLRRKQKWLRSQLERKEQELVDLQEKCVEHEQAAQVQRRKLSWLRSARDRDRQAAQDLRSTVRERDERIRYLTDKLRESNRQRRDAREQAVALTNSRSWRYTRILRRFKWR